MDFKLDKSAFIYLKKMTIMIIMIWLFRSVLSTFMELYHSFFFPPRFFSEL